MCPEDADGIANSVDPAQTAPSEAVWSVFTMFAQTHRVIMAVYSPNMCYMSILTYLPTMVLPSLTFRECLHNMMIF